MGDARAIGPIMLRLGASAHVLQMGDEVACIVDMAAVVVMDA